MILWIPVERIEPHPMNSNSMPQASLKKLARHLEESYRYEPLVVRPLARQSGDQAPRPANQATPLPAEQPAPLLAERAAPTPAEPATPLPAEPACGEDMAPDDGQRYQLLNGHHRFQVLRSLGHTHVRCDVWAVTDDEALMLLATLNRLEGRDDPMKRGRLLAALAAARAEDDDPLSALTRRLPEDRAALQKALDLATQPLPAPLSPHSVAAGMLQAVTFFLDQSQLDTLNRALRRTSDRPVAERLPESALATAPEAHGRKRADALLRLAESYLEFIEGEAC